MSAMMIEMNRAAAVGLAALLNTLWYAGAVVVLTWAGLRCARRVNAATRYWIWTGVLAFLIVVPFLPHLAAQARAALADRKTAAAVVTPLASVPASLPSIRQLAPVTLTLNTAPGSNPWPLWLLVAWIVVAAWQLERLARGVASVRRLKARAKASSHDTSLVSWACAGDTGKHTAQKRGSAEFRFPETLRPFRWKEKSRGVKEQLRATSLMSWACAGDMGKPTAQKPCRGYRLSVNIRRQARLITSAEIASPVAVGYIHPAVIVPPGLLERLEDDERQSILLHELAHLARYDDWMALLTHIIGAVLIFHPLSAIVLKQIEREREMACDDFVVARTGSARSYARSLARLHDLRWSAGTRLLAAGLLGRNSSLGDRIESLLRRGRKFSARPSLLSLSVSTLLLAVLLGAGGLMPGWIAIAQTKSTLPTSFEVASIRRDKASGSRHMVARIINRSDEGRFYATVVTAKALIEVAYGIRDDSQIEGGPKWIDLERFDVQAKADDAVSDNLRTLSPDQAKLVMQRMVQALLADRFKLAVHRETKELPVFNLVVAKNGPKLPEANKTLGEGPVRHFRPANGEQYLNAYNTPMFALAENLSHIVGRMVVDKTEIKGRYNFTMHWAPELGRARMGGGLDSEGGAQSGATGSTPDASGPSIFTALQEQLGLRLKPAKGPVEVLVIDHIEPPTPN